VRSRLLFSSVEESGRKPPSPDRAFSEILIQYSRVWAEGNADTAVVGAEGRLVAEDDNQKTLEWDGKETGW